MPMKESLKKATSEVSTTAAATSSLKPLHPGADGDIPLSTVWSFKGFLENK